jgi:hypothetical protein
MKFWNSKEWKTTKIVSIHIKSNSQQLLTGQGQDRNSSCVIPVVLEDCKIPIKLEDLTSSDMTIERDFLFEMRRLKTLLLPEVQE